MCASRADQLVCVCVYACLCVCCLACCAPQLPGPLVSAVSKLLGPLLADQAGPSIVLVSSNPAAAGGLYGPAGGIQQPAGRAAAAAAGAVGGGGGGGGRGGAGAAPSPGAVNTLVAMGFSRDQAVRALTQAGNDVQGAIALLVGGA